MEPVRNRIDVKGNVKYYLCRYYYCLRVCRYLLQVVTEAGCLEWALVLAVLLRDAMAVVRTAAAARAPTQSYAAVLRLLNIINTLAAWSSTQW